MSVPPQDPNQSPNPNQSPDPNQPPGSPPPSSPQGAQWQSGQPAPQTGGWQGGQPAPQTGGWQGGQPAPQPPSNQEGAMDAKGFFAALFDWRFHTLITPKIVSIVYLVGMILIGLGWLGALVSGFSTEPVLGLIVLIVGPVIAVVYLAFWRMTLEFYFAIVRMSDDIHRSGGAPRR
ncbi:DUF4282 domain-containing protein [Ornithinimicrobium murale]|uniref:DUF4282 domain-containing protein n=1 Tax=Ornithinimicrobium murale TaxID=1050153 RepID=UPI0013B38E1D|nr:DUF4282 domain-containing protein [Ornithinimicrobium murale]